MSHKIVRSLNYLLKTIPELIFDNPPPLRGEENEFKYTLDKNSMVVEMKGIYTSENEACSVVDPFLRTWELDTYLNGGKRTFWFEYFGVGILLFVGYRWGRSKGN